MDITEFFEEKHRRIEQLFRAVETEPESAKRDALFQDLIVAFDTLFLGEDEFLLPRAKDFPETRELALKATTLHRLFRKKLDELEAIPNTKIQWKEKLDAYKQGIHEVFENEEKRLFPRLRELITQSERELLTQQVKAAS